MAVVVHLDGGLDHGGAVFVGLVDEIGGDLLDRHLGVLAVAVPDERLHA